MSDYIKREDAVNAFRLWVLATHGHRYTNKECAPVFASIPSADVVPKDFHDKTCEAMAKRHTEEIQRLMPKRGEWIPCSERLPSEQGLYLTTYPLVNNRLWVDILWYGKPTFPEKDEPCFYASDDEYGDVEYSDVIAWMPLPKPYEEREDE